jgi:uncharacterized membrane protein
MKDFGWFVLVMWVIVASVALPLGLGAITQTPLLGLQALFALAGLVLAVVFVSFEASEAIAWVMVGLGLLGAITVTGAIAWLVSDDKPDRLAGQQAFEEVNALLAGVALPMYVTTAFVATLLGLILAQPFGG